jgi:hypothetical protein
MRCYCQSPISCTCDGVDGLISELTEAEARLEILKERQRVNCRDSATDALIAKVEKEIEMSKKPQGRDLYIHRLEHMIDGRQSKLPINDS